MERPADGEEALHGERHDGQHGRVGGAGIGRTNRLKKKNGWETDAPLFFLSGRWGGGVEERSNYPAPSLSFSLSFAIPSRLPREQWSLSLSLLSPPLSSSTSSCAILFSPRSSWQASSLHSLTPPQKETRKRRNLNVNEHFFIHDAERKKKREREREREEGFPSTTQRVSQHRGLGVASLVVVVVVFIFFHFFLKRFTQDAAARLWRLPDLLTVRRRRNVSCRSSPPAGRGTGARTRPTRWANLKGERERETDSCSKDSTCLKRMLRRSFSCLCQ